MKPAILYTVFGLIFPISALPTPAENSATSVQIREDVLSKLDSLESFEERQSCYATCANICYYQSSINNAVSDGYTRYKSGNTQGSYPHIYNNYEGFDFPVTGPYQEYPVLSTFKAYSGASPGADRVIFNTRGVYAGSITHNGASGNNFVACK